MKERYVGKTLKNEKDEEYLVIEELQYKSIPCVYAMKVMENDTEGEKLFFQVSQDEKNSLVSIKSKKMLVALSDVMFNKAKDNKPRKIEKDEAIVDYMAYLDDFYKSKIATIM